MENVNSENKVVEYEIITTKKYRQVVKVQFDEKYSDELNETKITPSDIDFELGEEIDGDVSFTTKIVNEKPDRFLTFRNPNTLRDTPELFWGEVVPNGTKSVLKYTNNSGRGQHTTPLTIYLNCDHSLVEVLWSYSHIKELSSFIIDFFPHSSYENGLDILKTIYKLRKGTCVNICVYEVSYFQRNTESIGYSYVETHFDKDKSDLICLYNEGSSRKDWVVMMGKDYKEIVQ